MTVPSVSVTTTSDSNYIHVTVVATWGARCHFGNKAAAAARKEAGGKIWRISSGGSWDHETRTDTRTFTYARG